MNLHFFVVLAVLSSHASAADSFTLVANGQARAQIVTGADAPETVRFAARELRTFVARMSGAELPIAARPTAGVPAIRLGPAARAVLPPQELKDIRRDGYLITLAGGDLCIVGLDDSGHHTDIEALLARGETHSMPTWDFNRGTLYGVYRLLETLGMRWFLPGEFGQRAPRSKTLTFSGTIRANPHFISRTVGYWSIWIGNYFNRDFKKITVMPGERRALGFTPAENRMWELRMRGATFQIPLNHYPSSTRWVERFGREHPEYFALYPDGSRSSVDRVHDGHLCYTEPGVVRESAADVQAFLAGRDSESRGISRVHPITKKPMHDDNKGWPEHIAYAGYFSLLPHDGFRPCACPRCTALISTSDIKGGEHSRLVWPYIARCAAQVPEGKVTCLAYGTYARPYPGMEKLPANVVVGFCAFSHPASLFYKDAFEQYQQSVRSWAERTHGKLAFWQHYLASNRDEENVGIPEHTPQMYARVVRVMARYGNHVFCEMMADSIMFELFNRYLLMKLFYDPTLDERDIFRDYVLQFYGPQAGPLVAEIYADINAKCVERFRSKCAAYSIWERLFGEATMRCYQEKAARAWKSAAGTEYEPAVAAFRNYYLGLMERGRARYVDPLSHLLAGDNPDLAPRLARLRKIIAALPSPGSRPSGTKPVPPSGEGQTSRDSTRSTADFEAGLRVASALCKAGNHAEAIKAWLKLGTSCSDPEERYQAIGAAAECVRLHQRSEDRALELCQQINAQPYVKAARARVYQWASSPKTVLAEFRDEDFSSWPESLAAVGFSVRGMAHFQLKNGPEAARDYLRAFQFARSYDKWSAFQRLGDTCWKLLDDPVLAEACYRKCMSDFGGGWPGLQARVNLGELLCAQRRYDDALKCFTGSPPVGGSWRASMLLGTARVHLAAGRKPEAVAALKQALATVGMHAHQKSECESLLDKLK
jgi:tetratricopeptide (TPR) repeat protein